MTGYSTTTYNVFNSFLVNIRYINKYLGLKGNLYITPKKFVNSFQNFINSWHSALFSVSDKGHEEQEKELRETEELERTNPEIFIFNPTDKEKEEEKEQSEKYKLELEQWEREAENRFTVYKQWSEDKQKRYILKFINNGIENAMIDRFGLNGCAPEEVLKDLKSYLFKSYSYLVKNGYKYNKYFNKAAQRLNDSYEEVCKVMEQLSDYKKYRIKTVTKTIEKSHKIYDYAMYFPDEIETAADYQALLNSLDKLNNFIKEYSDGADRALKNI